MSLGLGRELLWDISSVGRAARWFGCGCAARLRRSRSVFRLRLCRAVFRFYGKTELLNYWLTFDFLAAEIFGRQRRVDPTFWVWGDHESIDSGVSTLPFG